MNNMCPPLLLGTAAISATGTTAAVAATSGLFGAGGVFSLGATLSTLGTVGSVFSTFAKGQQKGANLEYQGQMARYRATIDDNNALSAKYAAEHDRQMFEDRYKRTILAKQAPGYAISGVVGTAGTPLMVQTESYLEGLREEEAIKYTGQTAAAAHRQAAIGERYAAANYDISAGRARMGGYISAGTSLMSGVARRWT